MHAELGNAIVFPPFRLDVAEERLWRGQEPVALKPRAFAILRYLLEHPRRLVTKSELLTQVWGDIHVNDAVLKTHLREIRRALDDDVRAPRFIETAHRRGYRFVGRTEPSIPSDAGAPPEASERAAAPPARGAAPPERAAAPPARGAERQPPLAGSRWVGRAAAGATNLCEAEDETASLADATSFAEVSADSTASSADSPAPSADSPAPSAARPAPAERSAAPESNGPPHFVGRTSELAWLRAAFGRAVQRERQIVLVSGAAGMGKTSFVRAFLDGLQGAASVAWGQCAYPYGADNAYLPLMEAFSRLGRGPDRVRWSELFNRCAPGWVARLPSFHPAPGARPLPSTGDSAGAEHLVCQLADAVDTFAREEPLLLVLEDVQWADAATVGWLTYIAQRTDPARLLVLCTFRPLEVSRRSHPVATLKHAVERRSPRAELRLPPLSQSEVVDYFASRFAGSRLEQGSARLLHECSAGNPSLIVRVTDRWLEQGRLVQRAGEWRVSGEVEELRRQTPEHVLPLLEQEYEQLTGPERDILDAASVAGAEFSAASIAGALGANLVAVEELCVRWAKHGQYFAASSHHGSSHEGGPDGTLAARFAFAPALYRDAAYHRLGAARRAELHLGVARWLERSYGERSADVASELAFHFEQAHDHRRAVMHLCTAAERSLATRAHAAAGQQFERCLALLRNLSTGTQRARVEIRLQVGVATLLASTRHDPVARVAAAQTAITVGRHFLSAANSRDDEMARLRSMLLLGMAEACLGDLSSARARLEYATASQQDASAPISAQAAARVSATLVARPGNGLARLDTGIAVPSVALDHGAAGARAQAMVLAPVWHAMLRSFLAEAGANDAFADVSADAGVPWAERDAPGAEIEAVPASPRPAVLRDPSGGPSPARVSPTSGTTLAPDGPPAQWVEGLLHHALSEADRWFGDTSVDNDLDPLEPQFGYR